MIELQLIDHIGYAVHDLDETIDFYTRTYNIQDWEIIDMPERHMKVAVTRLGDTLMEFIAATSEEAAFAKYLKDKGAGVHHIAYRVDDINAAIQELESKGVRMIDKEPRPGIHNTLIAFVHPRSGNQGVLTELVQHQDAHH